MQNYKHSFVLLVLFGFFLSQGKAQKNHLQQPVKYVVNGKLDGIKEGKIYLFSPDLEPGSMDSTYIKDGVFSFRGPISEPMFYILKIEGKTPMQMGFFLEPGGVSVRGHKDSMSRAIVLGSRSHDEWKQWSEAWRSITTKAGVYYRRLDSVTQQGKITASADERAIFEKGMALLNQLTADAVIRFIKEYPHSPVGPFVILDRFINYPNPEMETKTVAMLGPLAKNSFYGKKIAEYQRVAAKTGIGAAPAFSLPDTMGQKFELASLHGKYVLVDFWASWCVPCRKENPNVVKAYQKFHDKGFEIVGVSLDTKKEAWMKAIEKDQLNWFHVSDLKGWDSELVKEYGIKSVPSSFILNREGKVIAKNLRAEKLLEQLEKIFSAEGK